MYANDFVNVETSPKKIVHDTIEVDLIFGYTTDTSPELGQGRAGCLQCLGESRRITNQHQFVTHVGSHHWTCRSDQQIRGRRLLHVAQARFAGVDSVSAKGGPDSSCWGNAGPALDQLSIHKLSTVIKPPATQNIYKNKYISMPSQVICEFTPPKPWLVDRSSVLSIWNLWLLVANLQGPILLANSSACFFSAD